VLNGLGISGHSYLRIVDDATLRNEYVGASILMTRKAVIKLGDLKTSVKRLSQIGANPTGVVFTGARAF
jgi:Mrp family chromosome partitioning ATPase